MAKRRRKIEAMESEIKPLPDFAVRLSNVCFRYADEEPDAVKNLTLDVRRGEFLAVLGHNGSGKSTLARLICGLLFADKGEVLTWGYNPSEKAELGSVREHAGIVFQNPDNQTVASIVEDDVAFGPENFGVPREEIGQRIDWALSAVGMEKFRHSTPARLSGGQKQRVAVAGVLAIKPDILILDESTAMLDPKGRREVMEVASRLNRENGMTVILITHFLEEALLADRALVMYKGEMVASGTPSEIFSRGEELEAFNLCLPEIEQIGNSLRSAGIETGVCLRPEEMAEDLSEKLLSRGVKNVSAADTSARVNHSGRGEWDIDVKNLTYTYSAKSPFASKALNGVNLHVPEGEFFGIIGHTGSGKSTLIQHLNALIKLPQAQKRYKKPKVRKGQTPPEEPSVRIGKYDLADRKCEWRALRADVGMVFQYPEYQLFAETVFNDVAFGLKNFKKGISQEETESAVRDSLRAVGLDFDEIKDKSPFELSGGQKRRVAIAGVIVTKPKILILDEPAAGLDPLGKREIMSLLHSLRGDWCRTVIIVSHDMDEIAENCTSACVVSEGKVFACDSPENLFKMAHELYSLGLDIPLTAKLCKELAAHGVSVECDFTAKGFSEAVIKAYAGGCANV